MLSLDSRNFLSTLLPSTAFFGYQPVIEPRHPSSSLGSTSTTVHVNQDTPLLAITSPDALDPAVFVDPHFLGATHTFQDHLYSNWLSDAHAEKVRMFEDGVREGSLHAPWKDQVWERDHMAQVPHHPAVSMKIQPAFSSVLAGCVKSGEDALLRFDNNLARPLN